LSAPAQTSANGLGALLGTRMKERRLELRKKLAEVAAAADVSTGYLSAIENGSSVPSLPVLARLSHALELSLSEMLRTSASTRLARGRLTDALGRKRLAAEGSRMQIVRLAGRPDDSGRAPVTLGETDVFVFLHRGRLAVDVDEATFELAEGDALHCELPGAVTWRVLGSQRAVSIWTAAAPERGRAPTPDR
jgi:transcriptional regulator with XRE-family HTH domain